MRIILGIMLLSICFIVGCNALKTLMSENELEKKVRQQLDTDMRLAACDITITADEKTGVVTLAGVVSLPELIETATDLAKEVEGVKEVINKITMQEVDSGQFQDDVSTPAGSALGF
jgi:hypothetical protein